MMHSEPQPSGPRWRPRSASGVHRLTPEELNALKRVGAHLVGLCPLHHETRPSFTVYPQSGTFYCFGCRQGGDVIDLVRRLEGIGFVAAVERLAGPQLA